MFQVEIYILLPSAFLRYFLTTGLIELKIPANNIPWGDSPDIKDSLSFGTVWQFITWVDNHGLVSADTEKPYSCLINSWFPLVKCSGVFKETTLFPLSSSSMNVFGFTNWWASISNTQFQVSLQFYPRSKAVYLFRLLYWNIYFEYTKQSYSWYLLTETWLVIKRMDDRCCTYLFLISANVRTFKMECSFDSKSEKKSRY